MSIEQFDQTLRTFKYHEPFVPFVIETTDGRSIFVDDPKALGWKGAGGFVSADYDLVSFSADGVRDVRFVTPEAAK
jgi:hypothetical protein